MGGPWTLAHSSYTPVLNGNNGSYTNTDDHFNTSWIGKPISLPKAVRARMKGASYAVINRYNCPMGLASMFNNELKKYKKFSRYFWIVKSVHKTTTITIYRYVKRWAKKVEVLKLRPKIMEPKCTIPVVDAKQHKDVTTQEIPCMNKVSIENTINHVDFDKLGKHCRNDGAEIVSLFWLYMYQLLKKQSGELRPLQDISEGRDYSRCCKVTKPFDIIDNDSYNIPIAKQILVEPIVVNHVVVGEDRDVANRGAERRRARRRTVNQTNVDVNRRNQPVVDTIRGSGVDVTAPFDTPSYDGYSSSQSSMIEAATEPTNAMVVYKPPTHFDDAKYIIDRFNGRIVVRRPGVGSEILYYNDDKYSAFLYPLTGILGTETIAEYVSRVEFAPEHSQLRTHIFGIPVMYTHDYNGEVYPVIDEGSYIPNYVATTRAGCATLNLDSQRSGRVHSAVILVDLPGHETVDTVSRYVFVPLYTRLAKVVARAQPRNEDIRTCAALRLKYYHGIITQMREAQGMVIEEFLNATVDAILHMMRCQTHTIRFTTRGFKLIEPVPLASANLEVENLWITRNMPVGISRPWVLTPVEVVVNYELRPGVEFGVRSGVFRDRNESAEAAIRFDEYNDRGWVGLPVFRVEGTSRRDMTVFCWAQLTSLVDETRVPCENTLGMQSAVKRIAGVRGSMELEQVLVANEGKCIDFANRNVPEFIGSYDSVGFAQHPLSSGDRTPALFLRTITMYFEEDKYARQQAIAGVVRLMNSFCDIDIFTNFIRAGIRWVEGIEWPTLELNDLQKMYWGTYFQGINSVEQERRIASLTEHEKRDLRLRFFASIGIHIPGDTIVTRAYGKIKLEAMKHGKAPRLFCSYDEGWLAGPYLPEAFKMLADGIHDLEIGGIHIRTIWVLKPTQEKLDLCVEHLLACIHKPNTSVIVAAGDDYMQAVNLGDDNVFVCNGDLSSCDSSQRRFTHTLLHTAYKRLDPDTADAVIKQSKLPIRIGNPADAEGYYDIYPDGKGGAALGSGSVNTTPINSMAAVMVGLAGVSYSQSYLARKRTGVYGLDITTERLSVDEWSNCLEEGAKSVGFITKPIPCMTSGVFDPTKIEFLKHFYCPRNAKMIRMPTSYLRNFLTMKGQVTSTRLNMHPAEFAQSQHHHKMMTVGRAVTAGLKHEPEHSIMASLRARFTPGAFELKADGSTNPYMVVGSHREIDVAALEESICDRYGLQRSELTDVCRAIENIQVGQRLPVLTKFLHVDYGFDLAEGPSDNFDLANGYFCDRMY